MANYKDIHGFNIQSKSSDPTTGIAGDMYYNSSTGQFKAIKDGGAPIGSWASGGNMNTARYTGGGGGSTTAGVVGGGYTSTGVNNAETYNGTSWTEVNELNTARGLGASASQTPGSAALIFGGWTGSADVAVTEYWNGSSWAEQNDLNTGRRYLGGAGDTYTAALAISGKNPPGAVDVVESWNGSSWTEVSEVNTARLEGVGGSGTNTAALAMGGRTSPPSNYSNIVESWNGSAWTETTDFNTGRAFLNSAGTQTASLIAFGYASPGNVANTEDWNGTTWTEVADGATAISQGATGTGTGPTNLLQAGGYTTTHVATTQEWTAADFEIKTVTTS